MSEEYGRIHGLAKIFAKSENSIVVVYRNEDGTYGFMPEPCDTDKQIIEYITPY